jgi:hypothetical protein
VRRPGLIVLAVTLLVGSVAAFTYTQKLKLERSPIATARFERWLSPECDCPRATAGLSFLLRERERIDATIVDGDGNFVRTLLAGSELGPGRVRTKWDGRDEAGRIVPDGEYRVRVRMRDERRTIVIPVDVHVDTVPPRAQLLGVSSTTLGPGERIQLSYATNEFGRPFLLVDGELAARGSRRTPGRSTVVWGGRTRRELLMPGIYAVSLIVQDRAGNRSEPTASADVAVTAGDPGR